MGGVTPPNLAVVFDPALEFGKLFLIPLIRGIVHLSLKLLLIVI